jgi:hypothetical protein
MIQCFSLMPDSTAYSFFISKLEPQYVHTADFPCPPVDTLTGTRKSSRLVAKGRLTVLPLRARGIYIIPLWDARADGINNWNLWPREIPC